MNKLPAKQIYLLFIIIVGIIMLSVYSTYALFTYESSTSDVVTIHTPKTLTISENIYEYQQIIIEPNTITTTDVDIYNSYEYDVCYSVWYKIIGKNIDENKVQIFQKSDTSLTSSGVLTLKESVRITIAIINDNEEPVKINIGTLGAQKQNDSCSLNLDTDKSLITESYQNIETLSNILLKEIDKIKEEKTNYITYKNIKETIKYQNTDKIYISETFTYNNEIFTLEKPIEITLEELIDSEYLENNLEPKDLYFCQNSNECQILYKIIELVYDENEESYNLNSYDKLLGYKEGKNGLRKIDNKDYIYYGDNPNNYIYYNCKTADISTCELWRIIGLIYDTETKKYNIKIIRNESIGKYQFDSIEENKELLWTTSTLQKYLNEEYKLNSNNDIYTYKHIPNNEILSSLDSKIKIEKQETESVIDILSIQDYINSSICEKNKFSDYNIECLTNNWLNNIEITEEWTKTQKEPVEIKLEETPEENLNDEEIETPEGENELEIEENEEIIEQEETIEEPIETKIENYAYTIGKSINEKNVNEFLDIRPIVYLQSRMILVDGDGTFINPYVIK